MTLEKAHARLRKGLPKDVNFRLECIRMRDYSSNQLQIWGIGWRQSFGGKELHEIVQEAIAHAEMVELRFALRSVGF
jgi:hypothetical protein